MSSKTYVIIKRKFKYSSVICNIERLKIKCIGGENMPEEKEQLVFVDINDIPKTLKGKQGRNWKELFESIPKGKGARIPESYGTGATIRQAVKKVNTALGKQVFKATQRTEKVNDKDVAVVYVYRK